MKLKDVPVILLVLAISMASCTSNSGSPKTEFVTVDALGYGEISVPKDAPLDNAYFVPLVTSISLKWIVFDAAKTQIGFLSVGPLSTTVEAMALVSSLALGNTVQNVSEGKNLFLRVQTDKGIEYWEVNQTGAIVNKIQIFEIDPTTVQMVSNSSSDAENSAIDFDYVQQNQPPPDWKPPEKEYCGQDMVKYNAMLALEDVVSMLANDLPDRGAILESNIWKDFDRYDPKSVGAKLKSDDCYFYKGGGSVYGDYKFLRNRHFKFQGAFNDWVKTNITTDMSTEQAFEIVLRLVQTWW